MQIISQSDFKTLYLPPHNSHKGQNGRLLVIGGSHLFHAASLWALQVASRIVDLVHYSSIDANNKIVQKLKEEFRNGIVVPRAHIEDYIEEDDVVLIGPGMIRSEASEMSNVKCQMSNVTEILEMKDEGVQTYYLTKYLLQKYPHKKWVIDAGALQMLDLSDIPKGAILTPHHKEFDLLKLKVKSKKLKVEIKHLSIEEQLKVFAHRYGCNVLLKGEKDIVSDGERTATIAGGNAGMTKGGTGDVLAGLIAALYCKNDGWTATTAGSYINKKAGEDLFKTKGYWFNASDLTNQIPEAMKRLLL